MTYIEIGEWPLMQAAAQSVRTAVFVHEQGIAPEDEWDADDATALHAVLFDVNGQALGNARLLQPLDYRGQGGAHGGTQECPWQWLWGKVASKPNSLRPTAKSQRSPPECATHCRRLLCSAWFCGGGQAV